MRIANFNILSAWLVIAALAGCGDSGTVTPVDAGPAPVGDGGGAPDGPTPVDSDGGAVADPCGDVSCENGSCDPETLACVCEVGWSGESCNSPTLPTTEDLVLWLDAADGDSLLFDGMGVTDWLDRGPAGLAFAAEDSSTAPSLSSIGTRPALRFDGIDDRLEATGFEGLSGALQYTMMIVVSAGEGHHVLSGYQGADSRMRLADTAFGMSYTHTVPAGSSSTFSAWGDDWPYERDAVQVITVERTNEATSIWVDGGHRIVIPADNPEPIPAANVLRLVLGDDPDDDDDALGGLVGEVLVFADRLDFATRESVESYLAAKWDTAEPNHDLSSVGNTVLWLDAADEGSFTTQDDGVRFWNSRVGDFRFEAAAPSTRPARIEDGLNGLPVVRFDGVDDVMNSATIKLVDDTGYTIAVVFRREDGTNGPVFYGVDGENRPGVLLQAETGPERFRFTHRSPPAFSGGTFVGVAEATIGEPMRAVVSVNETHVRLDTGSAAGTRESDSALLEVPALDELLTYCLGGSRPGDEVNNFTGDIAEVVVFAGRLNGPQREYVQATLDGKWGF